MKTERFDFRLSKELKAELMLKAKKGGISLAEFFLRSAKQCTVVAPALDSNLKLKKVVYTELGRIGNNINQIARYANIEKQLDENIMESLGRIEDELKSLIDVLENGLEEQGNVEEF